MDDEFLHSLPLGMPEAETGQNDRAFSIVEKSPGRIEQDRLEVILYSLRIVLFKILPEKDKCNFSAPIDLPDSGYEN